MKKNFCFLILVMLFSFVASAQRFEYQLGLKGGLGVAWIGRTMQEDVSKDNSLCYKFGLTGIYYFGENYGITSGFNIIGNNVTYHYNLTDASLPNQAESFKAEYKSTYCQIPMILKMRTDDFGGGYRVFGEIGYGLDFLVEGNYRLNDKRESGNYRDVCSSFIVHLGFEKEVLSRSTLQFIVAYDNFFTNMMSSKSMLTMNNICFEVGFLF